MLCKGIAALMESARNRIKLVRKIFVQAIRAISRCRQRITRLDTDIYYLLTSMKLSTQFASTCQLIISSVIHRVLMANPIGSFIERQVISWMGISRTRFYALQHGHVVFSDRLKLISQRLFWRRPNLVIFLKGQWVSAML